MTGLLIRWLANAVALFITVQLIPGIRFTGSVPNLLLVALVFGIVNAVLKPILTVLTCPLILLTLGLFALVLNGAMLLVTAALSEHWGLGFSVTGWVPAILGGLMMGVVSFLVAVLVRDAKD